MTKVSFGKLPVASKRKPKSVTEKHVRDAEGRRTTFRKIDAGSPTFGSDLLYVFGRNVAEARRENERVVGVADIAPAS